MSTSDNVDAKLSGNGNNGNGHFSHEENELNLQEYLQIILRGKWIVILTFVIVLAITIIYTLKTTPTYESTAKILVDTIGQVNSKLLFDFSGSGSAKNINNELEILKSRPIAKAVADTLIARKYVNQSTKEKINIILSQNENGEKIIAPSVVIASRLMGVVEFNPLRESDVICIKCVSSNPEEAALIANTYAQVYYDYNLSSSRSAKRSVRNFLEDQLKEKKSKLVEAENALQTYMEESKIVSIDEEATKVIEQLTELEAMESATELDLQTLSEKLKSYQEQLQKLEPNVAKSQEAINDPYIPLLQEEIAQLEVQRDVMVAQNPSEVQEELYSGKFEEIEDQISSLREKLKKRMETHLQSLFMGQAKNVIEIKQNILQTQVEMQVLQAKKQGLSEIVSEYRVKFEAIPEKSLEYARLQRTRRSLEKLYLMLEERYNESTIAEQSEFGYVKIIEPALVPNSPIKPKKRMNLALGMILGLGLGVGIVFLKEYISDTIHTPEEITQKNWILLSTIPKMNGKKVNGKNGNGNGNGKKSKEKIFIQDGIDKLHLLSFINPRSILAESYRQLRTNINYAQIGKDIKTILVSSPNPGEGKTTTATNLAVAYAQMGKKVLLLETDLRRPNIHKRFHCEKEPGLVNLLLGDISQSEIIDNCRVENLHIICCGSIPPNPAEMLSTDKMRKFMEEMRESYDVIILDSPPVLAVADPVILSTLVDGVIFVVSASRTTFHSTELSFERVERVGGKVLGIVLNKFDPRRAYGGYYNYKSKYYYNYYYNNKTYYSSEEVDINNDPILERL